MKSERPHPDSSNQDPAGPDARAALMHAVLDGTADIRQVNALDALLARDAGAAEEFAVWKALFQSISAVPMEHPPEGLVAAISMAVAAELPVARKDSSSKSQLFSDTAVFASGQARRFPSGLRDLFRRPNWSESSQEFGQMNASRKMWAGGALAAVALGIVVFASGYPPKAEDLTGTVAPAERYRAPQAGGEAIKLGDQGVGSTAAPALATAGIEAGKADASRMVQKTDAQSQAQNADASRLVQKTDAQLLAEKADASRMAQKTDAQLQAEKVDASRMAQKTDAQLQAEKADASRMAQKTDAQLHAGKADASRMAQKTDAQLQAEKADASKAIAERARN